MLAITVVLLHTRLPMSEGDRLTVSKYRCNNSFSLMGLLHLIHSCSLPLVSSLLKKLLYKRKKYIINIFMKFQLLKTQSSTVISVRNWCPMLVDSRYWMSISLSWTDKKFIWNIKFLSVCVEVWNRARFHKSLRKNLKNVFLGSSF